MLHAIIGIKGDPLSLRVVYTQVDSELARAAVEAVSKWRYSPTILNGDPIEVDTTVTVNFRLLSRQSNCGRQYPPTPVGSSATPCEVRF